MKFIIRGLTLVLLCAIFNIGSQAQNWESLEYNPDQPGLEYNPLKGFMTLWNPGTSFPRSIEGRNFGLDDIMKEMNTFDWTVIDNFINQTASRGNFSSIQVIIDPANGKTDMPSFLIDQVDWKTKPSSLCPDWNNETLMQAMLNFISAFGEKYNNDSRIFLVTLGLYGMWGEWHVGSDKTFDMTQENKTRLANAYKEAFPETNLMARYADAMPDPQIFGYSDGLFFSQSISTNPANRWYFHNMLKINNADKNWMMHPVGGEIDPDLQSTIWKSWPNTVGQDVTESMDSIHPTFLICHYLFQYAKPGTHEWENAIRAQKMMGYSFFVDQYRLTASEGKITVELEIQNKGIAPMYANWDMEIGVLDSANLFYSIGTSKCNFHNIQPGGLNNYRAIEATEKIEDGTYKVLVRMVNPLEQFSSKAKPVRFANKKQDLNKEGWLTLGEMVISEGNFGESPVRVSGLTLLSESDTISVGESLQLQSFVYPENASRKDIAWISDHPKTAYVDANGVVTGGPMVGQATITAFTNDGGFEAKRNIIVEPLWFNIPGKIEAENYIEQQGVQTENTGDSGGGLNVGWIDNSDWMQYAINNKEDNENFTLSFRLSSPNTGGVLAIYLDDNQIGEVKCPYTGGWQNWRTVSTDVKIVKGKHYLKIVATKGGFNINYFDFKINTSTGNHEYFSDVHIYPVPATGSLTVNSGDWLFDAVEISDLTGKTVYFKETGFFSKLKLSLELKSGIYIIRLRGKDKSITKKIIISD